jgi:hypothetical protein
MGVGNLHEQKLKHKGKVRGVQACQLIRIRQDKLLKNEVYFQTCWLLDAANTPLRAKYENLAPLSSMEKDILQLRLPPGPARPGRSLLFRFCFPVSLAAAWGMKRGFKLGQRPLAHYSQWKTNSSDVFFF